MTLQKMPPGGATNGYKKTCFIVAIIMIVFYFNSMWYHAWHSTPEEIEASENKRMLQSIETANQTGRLELYPDFWYSAPEFYATKQFQMIRNLKGIRSFFCCGYPKIPVPAESVAAISTLTDLEEISLMNMHFEERALITLQELPKLQKISFYGCHVDVESLQHIGQFKSIESLTILCPMPFTGSNKIAHQIAPEIHP